MSIQALGAHSFPTFGELLKYLRRRERLTQLELSIAVGYSEAQISRLEKNQRLPDLATLKALFVPALHLEDEPELTARLLTLAEAARLEDAPSPGVAPYKGLLFFDEADADLFFGREALTERLAARVTELAAGDAPRFLAVVGASGSGKSSLVRAGLAVALKRAGWTTCVFTPMAEPLKALETHLKALPPGAHPSRALILVDQFEEAFTLCHDEDQRAAFIDRLLALADRPDPAAAETGAPENAVVVIALRADFYAPCAQYPRLREAVAAEQEYIGQMTGDELRRAIEEPAKRGGWELEPGLVDLLLHDIGVQGTGAPEPGALPLLSHALLATWEGRRGRTFTLAAYRASGGVQSAIAQTAENVFTDQLNGEQQELARDLFLRLTELGEGTEDTRRRAALTELARQSEEAVQLRTVLNLLAEARLITLNEDSAEVAHEALIREWQRLHDWLMEDRDGLRLHRQLTDAAYEWERLGRDPGALYRGARLAQAREWETANTQRLNESERAFLAASVEFEDREMLEREAQRQRELEAAQKLAQEQAQRAQEQARSAQQLRRRALVLASALALAVVLAGAALYFGRQAAANAASADDARRMASARELSASAVSELGADPERSVLLALQAVKASTQGGQPVLVEAEDALHRAVQTSYVLATLHGHGNAVWALALSRDGSRLASISDDGTAKVWDAASGQVLLTLPTGVTDEWIGGGSGAAFAPDGKQLLTVGADNSATVWDVATGDVVRTLRGHTGLVTGVAVSPDGSRFATASDDKSVKLWDAATGEEVRTLTGHEGAALVLAFSADGKQIYAGSDQNGVAIAWDVESGRELFRFSGQGNVVGVDAIAGSPDGTRLATGEFDTTVRIWDAASGSPLLTLYGHSSQAVSVAFSPDGARLASASEDGTIILWDPATGQRLRTLSGHGSGVMAVAFSPDGRRLYSASRDNSIRSWDVSSTAGQEWLNLVGHADRVSSVEYSPDGTRLATWSWDGTARVWDARDGSEQLTLKHDPAGFGEARFSPDGKRLAVLSGNTAVVYDAQSGALLLSLPPFDSRVESVAFSADGARIAYATEGGDVRVADAAGGKQLLQFTIQPLRQVVFSPDGQRIATAGVGGSTVWDAVTGEQVATISGQGADVPAAGVAFSPDGKWVAAAGNDGTVKVWDAATGAEIFTLTGHTGSVLGVAFSPDGRSLATSSVDRTVKVWRLPEAGAPVEQPLTLYGHTGAVYWVAFSPDGTRLASAGRNPIVREYALRVEDLVTIAQSRLTRALTDDECRKFLHVSACEGTNVDE
jgi:WD40 repeat protein/transcriptional regulator with XRE-family HTH domain